MFSLSESLRRYFVSFTLAATVTVGLVLLMQHLIRGDGTVVVEAKPPVKLEINPTIIEDPPIKRHELPEPPEQVTPPPSVALLPTASDQNGDWTAEVIPAVRAEPKIKIRNGLVDGGLLPIAQVAPQYPERARRSGVQGFVVVEFTVDTTGAVHSAVVIDAQPERIFDKAALHAVLRSKYRPKVIGGRAVAVAGVRKRVSFNLGD